MYKIACIFLSIVAFAFASYSWQQLNSANGQFPPLDSLRPVNYGNKVYSFGGFTENQDPSLLNVWSNDVYVFDGATWSLLHTTGAKPTPRGYDVVFVRGSSLYVVFGGSYNTSFGNIVQTNEMSSLDLNTNVWTTVTYNNAAPGGMFAPAGWYEPLKDTLYIFGGINLKFYSVQSTTYKFSFQTGLWTTLTVTNGPSGRYDAALTYVLGVATIYGGETIQFPQFNFVIPTDIQWYFSVWTETWIQATATAYPNPPRNNGNGISFDLAANLVLYGGDIGGGNSCPFWFKQNSVQETWLFNPFTNSWSKAVSTSNPPPLKRGATFFLNGLTYLYGGFYFTECTLNRNQNTYYLI